MKVKFIDRDTGLKPLEIVERIELSNTIMDNTSLSNQFLASLYFTCLVRHTSLFFFKSKHLHTVLHRLATSTGFVNERDFWLKTEDYVLRVKNQYTVNDIATIIQIYSKVNPSQLFWQEIE